MPHLRETYLWLSPPVIGLLLLVFFATPSPTPILRADAPFSTPVVVNDDNGTALKSDPAIAVSPEGEVVAAWIDSRDIGGQTTWIFSSKLNKTTGTWGTNIAVGGSQWLEINGLQLAKGSPGFVYGIFSGLLKETGWFRRVYFSKFDVNQGTWSTFEDVGCGGYSAYGEIATDSQGNAHIACYSRVGTNMYPIADHYRDAVTGNWTSRTLNDDSGDYRPQTNPKIGTDSSGNAYAAWTDYRNCIPYDNTSPGRCPDVYFRYLNKATGVWTTPEKVNDTPYNIYYRNGASLRDLAVDRTGNVYVITDETRYVLENDQWVRRSYRLLYYRSAETGDWSPRSPTDCSTLDFDGAGNAYCDFTRRVGTILSSPADSYFAFDNAAGKAYKVYVVQGTRIDIYSSWADIASLVPVVTGSVKINGGAAFATSRTATLTLSASSVNGVSNMAFSQDGTNYSDWESYTTSKSWTLADGDGDKTIYVKFKDSAGNISDRATSFIILDTTAPSATVGVDSTRVNSLSFTVRWSSFDTASGVASYDVQYREGTIDSWTAWQTATTATSATFTGLESRTYYFRARATDRAGNVGQYGYSMGVTPDVTPPTGDVVVAGERPNVTLLLTATDAICGLGEVVISNESSFSSSYWQSYAITKPWTLNVGQTVYVKFRDTCGNVSATHTPQREASRSYLPIAFKGWP